MPDNNDSKPDTPLTPLLRVCALLNKHKVRYLVIGGYACILHGLVRTTEDVDLLIEESQENYRRVIDALSEMEDHAARELVPLDFEENVVVKVADEVEVDVSRRAWKVDYKEAAPRSKTIELAGVQVFFLALPDLIASKETYREQDKYDLLLLRHLMRQHPGS